MFDLPIPQPEESVGQTVTMTTRPPPPPHSERFRAEALEYEGSIWLKRVDVVSLICALVGAAFGYSTGSANPNVVFTVSLLASAVFLYASRR